LPTPDQFTAQGSISFWECYKTPGSSRSKIIKDMSQIIIHHRELTLHHFITSTTLKHQAPHKHLGKTHQRHKESIGNKKENDNHLLQTMHPGFLCQDPSHLSEITATKTRTKSTSVVLCMEYRLKFSPQPNYDKAIVWRKCQECAFWSWSDFDCHLFTPRVRGKEKPTSERPCKKLQTTSFGVCNQVSFQLGLHGWMHHGL
jgi:hypothetical protein